jgi:hypothetical protein
LFYREKPGEIALIQSLSHPKRTGEGEARDGTQVRTRTLKGVAQLVPSAAGKTYPAGKKGLPGEAGKDFLIGGSVLPGARSQSRFKPVGRGPRAGEHERSCSEATARATSPAACFRSYTFARMAFLICLILASSRL